MSKMYMYTDEIVITTLKSSISSWEVFFKVYVNSSKRVHFVHHENRKCIDFAVLLFDVVF